METLKVYDKSETDFTKNGLGELSTAKDICIEREVNGEFKLSFSLPDADDKWQYIKQRNIVVCEGQRFRIHRKTRKKAGTLEKTVECFHIMYDAGESGPTLIPYLDNLIAYTPRAIMLTVFAGTDFHVMTEEEVTILGMTWVTDLTDILECSKVYPLTIINRVIENIQKGEIYIDNYNIAIVERVGKSTGIPCTLNDRLKSLEDMEDSSSVITRLYAFGKDDMPMSTTLAPNGYIDSTEGIALYGICAGYINFDTEDQDDLDSKALWQFDSDNPKRIDRADMSFTLNIIEFYKMFGDVFKFAIGDSVIIKDSKLNIDTEQRIVKYKYYPNSAQDSEITLGRPKPTIGDIIKDTSATAQKYSESTTQSGEVKAQWLETIVKNLTQTVYAGLSKELSLHKTGDLWEFGNNTAIAIVDGVLAIANERNPDGTWNFRTFGDGNGVTADEIITGILKGIQIQQISDSGKILMDVFKDTNGGVIKLNDINGNLNIKMGSEGEGGSNTGGTVLLYDDAPEGQDPTNYMRVGIAIDANTGVGIISLRNGNNVRQVQLEGDGGIFLFDSSGTQKGYICATYGYLNNENIATHAWAAEKGANTNSDSHSHTVTIGGTTYTTSTNTHSHEQA